MTTTKKKTNKGKAANAPPARAGQSLDPVVHEVFFELLRICADAARSTPNPLPGLVSDEHAALIAAACAERVLTITSQAMHKSTGGIFQ